MKKIALIIVMLFATTYASAGLIPTVKFGVKAGLDYQTNDLSSTMTNFCIRSNTGWLAGAMLDVAWSKWGIHPEAVYSRNSFNLSGADGRLKINQIDVPVLLSYNVLGVLKLQAGPRFCVMDNAGGCSNNVDWHIKTPTMGYAIGVESSLGRISLSARYNGAINRTDVWGFSTGKNKNSNIQLCVGYYF